MNADNIPLNDIAPLIEIHDYSLYYFIAFLVLVISVVLASVIWIRKILLDRKQTSRMKQLKLLHEIDLSDSKRAAYAISSIGRSFKDENERTYNAYQNLYERLEVYKYAPSVPEFDKDTISYFRIYLEILDAH